MLLSQNEKALVESMQKLKKEFSELREMVERLEKMVANKTAK